jgi:uncharacterized protein
LQTTRRDCLQLQLAFFALSAVLATTIAFAEIAVPPLKARVTDLTATLSSQQTATIEQTLAGFEKRTGSQIAVLIVATTQPETVEQYAVRVEEAWRLGRKGVDDGVLLLIAKNDRKLRIEVGYGLEGALTDAIAKRIIVDDIAPYFLHNAYFDGINAGVARIIKVVEHDRLPPPVSGKVSVGDIDPRILVLIEILLIAAATYVLLIAREKKHGYWWVAIAVGVVEFFAWPQNGVAQLFGGGVLLAFFVAVCLLRFSPPPLPFAVYDGRMRNTGGSGGYSEWTWARRRANRSGEYGESSNSSGSSSFGGGGGESGGGGASGSW